MGGSGVLKAAQGGCGGSAMRIKNWKDFWSGVLLISIGIAVFAAGRLYEVGTAAEMGPGYFPMMMGGITAALGLILCFAGLSPGAQEDKVEEFSWRVLLWILGPIVLFGMLLETIGLILSLLILVIASSVASREFSLRVAFISAVVLIAVSLAIFVWGLSLQFSLWPVFMQE